MNILFLYTELADYTIACLRELSRSPGVRIKVVHYPVNKEAPFQFELDGIGQFTSIKQYSSYRSLKDAVVKFEPTVILTSGWINKWYVRICMQYRNRANCVLTLDNHFNGSTRQSVFSRLGGPILTSIFTACWVPGKPQEEYALKLGFRSPNIFSGFYCCDTDRFGKFYQESISKKQHNLPRRFLCAARYVPQKGYDRLWSAFVKWKAQQPSNWELWCAGTGEDFDSRIQHPAIRHLGFIQKDQWAEVASQCSVFVLNSYFEPWGVVVHEFATAGFPMILSAKVGAKDAFLDSSNGELVDPANEEQLINAFSKFARLSDEQLLEMGAHSAAKARSITLAKWTDTLLKIAAVNKKQA